MTICVGTGVGLAPPPFKMEEDKFALAVASLQAIHQAGVQSLQEKLKQQVSLNHTQAKQMEKLSKTVKRLQGAVSKAKAKVIQQAAVISEQCIQLRNNGAQTFNHGAANSTSYDLTPINGPPTDHTCATLFDSSSMASNIGTKNGNSLSSLQSPIIDVESETKSKNVKTRVESTSSDSLETSAPPSPGLLDPPASTQHITPPSSGVLDSEGPHQDTTSSTSLPDSPTHRDVQNSSPPSPSFLDSPTHKEGLQQGPHHVVYSHAHNSKSDVVTAGHDQAALRLRANRNQADTTTSIQDALRIRERGRRGDDGTRAFQSLRGGQNGGSKVRYRSVTSTGVSLAPKEPRDGGADRFESQSSYDLSPSLLMTKSCSQREAVVEVNSGNDDDYGDYDGEEEEENPMSCSLFTTTTSSSQTPVAKKKGARVDLIAEAMLRRSPSGCDVVPVTPGIKSADSILSNDKWMATDAVLPQNRRDAVPGTGIGVRGTGVQGASNMKQGDDRLKYKRTGYSLRSVEVNPASKKACTGEQLQQRSGQTPATESVNRDALRIVKRDGLPTNYKFDMKILKRSDRDKLDAKPCPECQAWYEAYGNQQNHLKHTCRHKAIHLPPDTNPHLWEISFPDTEDSDRTVLE